MKDEAVPQKATREERFVESIIQRCKDDKGLAARLRRADNPATEYQCWDTLTDFGVDLEKDYERLPFATIAAAIAKSKPETNGGSPLGMALASCYEDSRDNTSGKARLRRLLACENLSEVCRILRPLFGFIQSKSTMGLDYAKLLKQLRRFAFEDARQRQKAQWAQEYYGQKNNTEANGVST